MRLLADTSVWVDHLRRRNQELADLLNEGSVLSHPHIIGELACGNLANRPVLLSLLRRLPKAPVAGQEEVLQFIESEKLHGRRLGWIDMHLLASARLLSCPIWTLDKALASVAASLDLLR